MDSCYITPKEDMHKGAYIIADPHKGLRDGALHFDAHVAKAGIKLRGCGPLTTLGIL